MRILFRQQNLTPIRTRYEAAPPTRRHHHRRRRHRRRRRRRRTPRSRRQRRRRRINRKISFIRRRRVRPSPLKIRLNHFTRIFLTGNFSYSPMLFLDITDKWQLETGNNNYVATGP